jgi:signal transduction histidine kinase
LAREPVELITLLERCVEALVPQAERAGVSLALDPTEPLTVRGDADRLAQVFANLLDNAVSHTAAGGRVAVTPRRVPEKHQAEVVVTDTGEGIPREALPRIFERFYQTDRSRRRSRGAGLGLAITREIVEAHGGTVDADSVVGLGSQFTVRLPLNVPGTSKERS